MEGGRKGDREGGANQVLKYEIKELRKKGRMREGREKEGDVGLFCNFHEYFRQCQCTYSQVAGRFQWAK